MGKNTKEKNMSLSEMLKYNREFVEKKEYEKYRTDKYPARKTAVLACMDTRLTELLLRLSVCETAISN